MNRYMDEINSENDALVEKNDENENSRGLNGDTTNPSAQYTQYETYNTREQQSEEQELYHTSKSEVVKGGNSNFFKKAMISISMGLFFGMFAAVGFYAAYRSMEALEETTKEDESVAAVESTVFPEDRDEDDEIKIANTDVVTVVSSDVSDVVEDVMPAMVSIVNKYTETSSFFGQVYTQEQAGAGSGIIVAENEKELLIVSNHHVVSDATTLEVTFIDGSVSEAKIKGLDSDMDLAVIAVPLNSIKESTRQEIAIAKLGDSDELKLGQPVIAIGNALGYGQSVTGGYVSALGREVKMEDGSYGTFIQTDAAINPGNSGGALLNVRGEVIGINSNKIGGSIVEGMGYAIPISSASPIISDLMERQTREKVKQSGYLGIQPQEVTEEISQWYNMPIGIFVTEVIEGEAAEKVGIKKGDIIIKFDGQRVKTDADLRNILQYYGPHDKAVLTICRQENGEYLEHEIEIVLGKRPD